MRTGAPSEQSGTAAPAKPLSAKHQRFVAEYVKDRNATKAYQRAYPNSTTAAAGSAGSRLLKDARISAAISQAESQVLEQVKAETGITLERTLREIGRLAFFDPRQLLNSDGSPKAITELDDDTAAAIAGLDVQSMELGGDEGKAAVASFIKKYKLSDKRAALDMLMRHLGGYKEDNNQAAGTLAELLSQVQRSSLPIASTVPAEDDDE
jgi:phage terminase small subunit